jgi:membrane fusion protein, multidrug efflux system
MPHTLKKNKRTLLIVATIVVVITLLVPKLLRENHNNSPTGNQPPGRTAPIKVAVNAHIAVFSELNDKFMVPGSILPNEAIELRAEYNGRIIQLLLREGAEVKKGTLLVKINDRDLQAQLKRATAALKLAENMESRQKTLVSKELISKEDYDQSEKELEACQADIDLINAQIEKTEIRAPFDGKIGLKFVSEGAYVAAGAKIADFVSVKPLKIEFSIPERYAGKINVNSVISFVVQGSQMRFTAKVFACQPAIDEATRSLQMRARCRDATGVYPGAFANVEIDLGRNNQAIMLPTESLVPDIKGMKVFLVKGGKAQQQLVTTGVRTEDAVEITSGISAGDTVVTSGVLMLRPGMTIDLKSMD